MAVIPAEPSQPRSVASPKLHKHSVRNWGRIGSRPQDLMTFGFQTVCWCWFMKVWLWHFTEAAKVLPGATGFGWFFRYLTFFGFTIQTLTLALSVFASCTLSAKNLASGHGQYIRDLADNFSSAAFGLANVVTAMFHIVQMTQGPESAVEGGHIVRPFWLGFTVHNMNCLVAWAHLIVSPHSFRPAAQKLSVSFMLFYIVWIQVCHAVNGKWPYPILNVLPMPWGFIFLAGLACVIFLTMFEIGRAVKRCVPDIWACHAKRS
uniref:Uncharacterized protein n=1 Tax=Tetraselmis chuii TaxID=63592 RepID=A0A7S1SPC0_9CHLO|mmetsp:Transcript_22654/g.40334  ORF Transcript_22654/g.40334 Transcript_22654/m.40334 type:complete len:262 (+) Transcript_22654:278-1063(+)